MKLQQWADFFFTGEAVVPAVLLWTDHFDLALLLILPLLFVAGGLSLMANGPPGPPDPGSESDE
jgi:hypothetical protein